MEAAVFDEYLVRARSRHDDPGNIDSRDVALQRDRIAYRTILFGRKLNPHAAEKIVIRMVADKSEDKIVLQANRTARRVDHYMVHANFLHRAVEVRFDVIALYAVFQVGLDPVLNVVVQLRAAIGQSDACAMPPQSRAAMAAEFLPPITNTSVS